MVRITMHFLKRAVAAMLAIVLAPLVPADAGILEDDSEIVSSFTRSTLTLDGGKRMNVWQRDGEGAALVLVPGTWGDIHRFTPMIAALPVELPVVIVELCWQGGNVPTSLDMTIESLTDDVLRVVEQLKIPKFFLGGHSGGMIAVEVAGREVPGLLGLIPMEGWTHHTVVQTAFEGVVTGSLPEAVAARSGADRARGLAHLTEEQREAIGTIWRNWNGYEALERSTAPVLHLWGDRGKPQPDRKALQIPEKKSIAVVFVPGTSHEFVLEAPETVAREVLDFMERVAPRPGTEDLAQP